MSTGSITVVGGGVSGLGLIEKIREHDAGVRIVLIDKAAYSLSPSAIIAAPGDISRRIPLAEWAKEHRIEYVQGTLERVSPRRQKLYLKDADPQDFERLVVATGFTSKKISVKGEHREGFFYLADIEAVRLRDLLKISQEAVVNVSTWLGVKLAFRLRTLNKEVRVVANNFDFIPESVRARVMQALERCQVSVQAPAMLEEAVGESMVKAVKVQPLKVFSAQLVFIDSGFVPNVDFFEESLEIRDIFFTQHDGVYVLGDAGDALTSDEFFYQDRHDDVVRQADALAAFFTHGATAPFERKILTAEQYCSIIDTFLNTVAPADAGERSTIVSNE